MINKFKVLIDTREQIPFKFPENDFCSGSVVQGLKEGDYTIKGAEEELVVERKASTSELALNFTQPRFFRELERLQKYPHKFIICEFPFTHIFDFPKNSGIPQSKWHKIRITPAFLLKNINEISLNYNVPFIFCDTREGAFRYCFDLFKRMNQILYNRDVIDV
jgi:hypothetical protein